jgi:glucokinase
MAVAGESPGMFMATTAADHAFLMAMVADIGGTNTNVNMDMETETDMDMAIAVGDFRGLRPPLF